MKHFVIGLLVVLILSTVQAQQYNVGVRRITTEVAGVEVPVRVFYPTYETAAETMFGPWKVSATKNAEPAEGKFPLIAISHGLGGNDWNHHLLASDLSKAGFVVAAIRHPDDLLRIGQPEISVLRPGELTAAIDSLLQDSHVGPNVDDENIGSFGFSLGGFTALVAAGGRIDYRRLAEHCKVSKNDPEFCIGEEGGASLPIWLRAQRMFYAIPKVDLTKDVYDPRIDAVVAAAPVGLPFEDLSRVQIPVLLLRAGADQSLRYPYHAENIHNLLTGDHTYEIFDELHHYAFLSPFPDEIAGEVGEPALNPDDFDRAGFLAGVNQTIVEFFRKNLVRN